MAVAPTIGATVEVPWHLSSAIYLSEAQCGSAGCLPLPCSLMLLMPGIIVRFSADGAASNPPCAPCGWRGWTVLPHLSLHNN